MNGQKTPTGYYTDLIGGLLLANGTHNNTISSDTFTGTSTTSGYSIGNGGSGFYFNVCTSQSSPFSPAEAGMGTANSFSNLCYTTTDATGLPPSTCKS